MRVPQGGDVHKVGNGGELHSKLCQLCRGVPNKDGTLSLDILISGLDSQIPQQSA